MPSKIIKDVFIYYTFTARPELKYQKKEDPKKPLLNKEYKTQVLMPVKTSEALLKDKAYKKVKCLQETKTYTADEFKKTFQVDAPDASVYADEDGEYTVFKFTRHASYNDGSPTKKVSVVGFKSLGNQSKNGFDINNDILISNGTLANLELEERKFKIPGTGKQGLALDLKALQIIDLIPYVEESTGFDDAGDVEGTEPSEPELDEEEGFDDAGDEVDEDTDTDDDIDDGDDDWEE